MKTFSIIIPVYREERTINRCLSGLAVLKKIGEAEVIVVDGYKGTTIRAIEKKGSVFPLISLISEKGRGVQLNRGGESASGDILIFLHADTRLPDNALSIIERVACNYRAGAFNVKINNSGLFFKMAGAVASLRSRITRIPYGDQVHFIRKELFFEVGGYQPIPIMEDVAMMLMLRKRGIKISIQKEKVATSGRRWKEEGFLKTSVRNWLLYFGYRLGVSPHRLLQWYKPHVDE